MKKILIFTFLLFSSFSEAYYFDCVEYHSTLSGPSNRKFWEIHKPKVYFKSESSFAKEPVNIKLIPQGRDLKLLGNAGSALLISIGTDQYLEQTGARRKIMWSFSHLNKEEIYLHQQKSYNFLTSLAVQTTYKCKRVE